MLGSWLDWFQEALSNLEAGHQPSAVLTDAFRCAAGTWADSSPRDGPPFSSGIGPDGSPVEISVQWRGAEAPHIRFIAQPSNPRASHHADVGHQIAVSRAFLERFGGQGARDYFEAIRPLLHTAGARRNGNFLVWLGAAVHPAAPIVAKLYLNPWSIIVEGGVAAVIYRLCSIAGVGSSAIRALRAVVHSTAPLAPCIVGFDLDRSGVRSTKIYFARRNMSAAEIALLARDLDLTDVGIIPDGSGEIHLALRLSADVQKPTLRANLLCCDWFADDSGVLSAIDGRVDARNAAIVQTLASSFTRGDRFNFVAFDTDLTTIYAKVAPMGGRSARRLHFKP